MTMLLLLLAASAVGTTVATGAEQDRAALLAFKNSGDAGSWPMNKLTGWMGDAGPVCGAGRTVKPWSGIACDEGLRVSKVDFVALTHEAHSGEVPPILTHEEGHKLTGDIKHLALLQNLKTLALTSTGATGDVAHFRGHQLKQIFISDTRTGGNMDGVCDQCGEFGHECVQWLLNCLSLLFCAPLLTPW